jgi:uncharacterized protein (DUF342 family)
MNKQSLLDLLKEKVQEKEMNLEKLIAETRASNSDTKSSMGDKYETSREMLQQEINNLLSQLNVVLQQKEILKSIHQKSSEKVEKGALVVTNKGKFFISISMGEIVLGSDNFFCISTDTPLAKAMMGRSVGDIFNIHTTQYTIEKID